MSKKLLQFVQTIVLLVRYFVQNVVIKSVLATPENYRRYCPIVVYKAIHYCLISMQILSIILQNLVKKIALNNKRHNVS